MLTPHELEQARDYLARAEPKLGEVIARIGPPQLSFEPNAWRALSSSIIGQQISTHAARAIRSRFAQISPENDYPTPQFVIEQSEETLRAVGLSGNKARSLRDLAAHFADGRLSNEKLAPLPDEEIIVALIPVRGIGRWTAEMFLLFGLGRPNVWAIDDLGLRAGVKRIYQLPEMPTKTQMREVGAKWSPHCSVASWYLWRMLDEKD